MLFMYYYTAELNYYTAELQQKSENKTKENFQKFIINSST